MQLLAREFAAKKQQLRSAGEDAANMPSELSPAMQSRLGLERVPIGFGAGSARLFVHTSTLSDEASARSEKPGRSLTPQIRAHASRIALGRRRLVDHIELRERLEHVPHARKSSRDHER